MPYLRVPSEYFDSSSHLLSSKYPKTSKQYLDRRRIGQESLFSTSYGRMWKIGLNCNNILSPLYAGLPRSVVPPRNLSTVARPVLVITLPA